MYNTNWKSLVTDLLIIRLRKSKMINWLYGLISPVSALHSQFIYYTKDVSYRLSINWQVCNLEKLLNDRFDIFDRRIRIKKPIRELPLVFFKKSENRPLIINRKTELLHKTLFTKSEASAFTVSFVVYVPVFVQFDINELTEMLNKHILLSKTFKVKIV